MAPKYFHDYSIFGIKVRVESTEKRVQDHLGAFFGKCPNVNSRHSPDAPIRFDFYSAECSPPMPAIPESAVLVSSPEFPLRLYKASRKFYLIFGKSWLQLSLPECHGIGVFDEKIWKYPGIAESLFFNGLCVMLNYCGLYRIHSAGLTFHEKGFLFIGKSGAGKSTLALTLVMRGWKYLNDDFLFFHLLNSRVEMLALPVEFKINEQTLPHFFTGAEQELAFKLPNPEDIAFYDKYFVGVDRLYPNSFASHCAPRFMLFTEVVSSTASKIKILTKNETLQRLLEASELFMFDAEKFAKHLAALNALIQQTTAYRLCAGTDVLENPQTFEKFLLDSTYRLEI